MIVDLELATTFTLASIRKFYDTQAWGIPVTYLQQEQLGNVEVKDEIQIQTMIRYPQRGAKHELYGLIHTRAIVKTRNISTDVYYHVRAKARVTRILTECIPLYRIGGTDLTIYNGSQWGILRRLPTNTISVTPTSIDIPNASIVEVVHEIQQID